MILNSPISCPVKGLEEITGLRLMWERVSKWGMQREDQLDVAGRDEVGKSEELRSNHRHATCLSLHLCRWSG
jgi:hypothetical protein